MAKRKISGIINATEHPMNLETPWNQKQPDGTGQQNRFTEQGRDCPFDRLLY